MTVCFWKLQLLIFKLIKNQEMILENCRGSYNTIPQPEAMYGLDGPGLVHLLVHGPAFPAPQDHHYHQQPCHHHHRHHEHHHRVRAWMTIAGAHSSAQGCLLCTTSAVIEVIGVVVGLVIFLVI